MNLEMLTPEQNLYYNDVYLVQLPSADGLFEIMSNHAPLIAVISKGKIKVLESENAQPLFFEINGGTIEVKSNKIIILLDQ